MGFFPTHRVTIEQSDGTVLASNLPVQMDPSNSDWLMQAQGMIPTDTYDVETIGWATPIPTRSNYLVDQNGTKYSLFSTVFQGYNSLQFQVTKYSGVTP